MIPIIEYLSQGVTESGSSVTLRIDLPENEQISMMLLELRMTNSSTIRNIYSILDAITSVEVIAGGKTLYSLEPEPASAACFYIQNGKLPRHIFFKGKTKPTIMYLPIYFGKFNDDEEYMLDTSLYKNPQLVIAWSMDTSYVDSGSFKHTVSYIRPLTKIENLRGFIRWREIKKATTSGSAETSRHVLPTDFPWHYLAVRVEDVDQNIRTTLSDVLVNIDAGRLRLIDVEIDELYALDQVRYRNPNSYFNMPAVSGNDTVHTYADGVAPTGFFVDWLAHRNVVVTSILGGQALVTVYADGTSEASDDVDVSLDIRSANPHQSLTLFDGRKTPFPITDYGQAWVDYKVGAYTVILYTYVAEIIEGAL